MTDERKPSDASSGEAQSKGRTRKPSLSALSAMGRSSQDLAALERDAKAQDASPVLALEEPETATTDFSAGANALAAETPEQPSDATPVEDADAGKTEATAPKLTALDTAADDAPVAEARQNVVDAPEPERPADLASANLPPAPAQDAAGDNSPAAPTAKITALDASAAERSVGPKITLNAPKKATVKAKRPSKPTAVKGVAKAPHLAPVPDTPAKTETAEGTAPQTLTPEQERIRARAQMLTTLASLSGVNLVAHDVAERLQTAGDAALRPETMVDALAASGLKAQLAQNAKPNARSWPAIAMMQGGQPVLVLEQTKAAGLVLFDTTCPDNRAEVPVEEFMPYFEGYILSARPSLAQLAQRHTPQLDGSHWFWGEFSRFRRQIAEIMLGSLVANLLAVSVALFSLQVYDRVVPHQSTATLWVLALGALLAIGLEGLLKIARAQITDAAGRQIDMMVQRKLMQRLIGLRADKKPLPPSGLFSAMRDFSSVREFFTSSTLSTLADVPFIAVFLLLVASIGGPVVWVIMLGGLLMLLPGYFLQKRMIALTRQTQGASTKSARLLQEVVTELETIKTQRGEERVLRLWDELNLLSSQASNGQRKLASALTYWSQGVQQATYICAVILGTYMVFAGEFTVGTIIATGILTSRTLAPLTQFAGTLARWSNVRAALEALDQLAAAPQEREAGRAYLRREKIEGRFELREVVFRYDDEGAPIVDVPAVALVPGQRIAVLGMNGSGKSTLLKLLAGLYAPEKGRVMLDGTDISQIEPRDLRRHIGYLGQEVRLFAGTLRDNLNLTMLERDDARLLEALDFAGLGAFVRAHPRGLDLPIGDSGAGLSIGQRQSIGWARLWLQDPSVLLLDEPTAALDQTLERTLVSRLEGWLGNRTAVIATHRMPILSLTNRTLILQAGRMVVDGPRDEVLAHLNAGNKP